MPGGGGTKVEQKSTLTQGQRALLDKLTGTMSGEWGQGVQPYSGKTVANASPIQTGSFDLAKSMLGNLSTTNEYLNGGGTDFANKYLGLAGDSLDSIMKPFDEAGTIDYFNTAVKAPVLKTWNDEIMPQIMERFAGTNAADSGAALKSLSKSGVELSDMLGQNLSELLYKGKEDTLNRQLSAIPQAIATAGTPTSLALDREKLASLNINDLSSLLNIGTMQRSMSQEQLDAAKNKYLEAQGYNNPWLKYLPTALGVSAFENVGTQKGPGLLESLLPVAGAAGGAYLGTEAGATAFTGLLAGL